MRRVALVPALLLPTLLVTATAAAQTAPTIPVQTLRDVTKELSSDAYEGRAPTTPGETKTVAYLIKRMQAAGLKPGNNGAWTQDVPMVAITATNVSPMTFTGRVGTGGKSPLSLAYRTQMVAGTYRATPRVDIKDSDVVFVGYGVNAPEKNWNDYAGLDVKGKTVVILSNDPDWMVPETKGTFNGREMTYYGRWTYKYGEAARQGARAAIIVHDNEPAAYPWAVVQSSWTGEQYELDAANNHMDQSELIGWMQLDQAKALFSGTGKDFAALSAAAAKPGFRAVPLGVKMSASFDNEIKKNLSHNVIGVLPGTSSPDDYVLYSAHWDHLGRCDPVDGDDICNGALDNASGTAGLIALAETFAKAPRTRRSIAFLAVTAEESGLLGSRYYAEHPIYPLGRTVGGVNMDGLNIVGATRDFEITGAGKSELENMVKPLLAAQGRHLTPEATPEKGHYFRSDHFSFAKLGVPMLSAAGGKDLVDGGVATGKAAADDYVAHRYHKPQDEYRDDWNWDGAVQDLTLYYQLGRQLADGTAWPNWYPTAEFKAIRDKSRAEAGAK